MTAERPFADASLVLLDTLSTSSEGANAKELASFRFSRDTRSGRPQANLAPLASSEELTLWHWLYAGYRNGVQRMAEASCKFHERLAFGSFVVADRGMISTADLRAQLNKGGAQNQLMAGARRYLRLTRA